MPIWPAMLLAPLLALVDQSVAYSLVGWACRTQHPLVPHLVHLLFLAATLVTLVPPIRQLEGHPVHSVLGHEDDGPDSLAMTAIGIGVISAATIAAMWIPQWVLSPCLG
jgi:hypothetical protein